MYQSYVYVYIYTTSAATARMPPNTCVCCSRIHVHRMDSVAIAQTRRGSTSQIPWMDSVTIARISITRSSVAIVQNQVIFSRYYTKIVPDKSSFNFGCLDKKQMWEWRGAGPTADMTASCRASNRLDSFAVSEKFDICDYKSAQSSAVKTFEIAVIKGRSQTESHFFLARHRKFWNLRLRNAQFCRQRSLRGTKNHVALNWLTRTTKAKSVRFERLQRSPLRESIDPR